MLSHYKICSFLTDQQIVQQDKNTDILAQHILVPG